MWVRELCLKLIFIYHHICWHILRPALLGHVILSNSQLEEDTACLHCVPLLIDYQVRKSKLGRQNEFRSGTAKRGSGDCIPSRDPRGLAPWWGSGGEAA